MEINEHISGLGRKWPVVPTYPVPKQKEIGIMTGHHVFALQGSPEGWQGTPHLEHCGKPPGAR
ncbi:MAG: hypothetical protein KDM81_08695, partial [Verrucomicrobiae bacterium]|nr:hypothetical protein [Verrucomicrobiae bacterium]